MRSNSILGLERTIADSGKAALEDAIELVTILERVAYKIIPPVGTYLGSIQSGLLYVHIQSIMITMHMDM